MEQIKKNFGFGCMRLPMNGSSKTNTVSDCVKCGRCEKVCPQHLPIRRLLEDVAKKFEKEAN